MGYGKTCPVCGATGDPERIRTGKLSIEEALLVDLAARLRRLQNSALAHGDVPDMDADDADVLTATGAAYGVAVQYVEGVLEIVRGARG